MAPLGFGVLFGCGILLAYSGLVPRRASLAQVLHAITPPAPTLVGPRPEPGGWAARVGRPLAPLLAMLGLPRPTLAADLAVCDRSPQRHAAEQATAIVAGLAAPHLLAALLWAAGSPIGWTLPAWTSLAAAVAAGAAADQRVRRQAARRRGELRHALSVQLDLTMMGLAGGAGVEQALADAARVGDGFGHRRLRHALHAAQAARLPVWDTLGQLGATTRVSELTELAAAVGLAGEEGARIRTTLAARAAALRQRQITAVETAAAQATERMALPTGLLLIGFMITIIYPAVANITTGL
jgi:Flp pilus assembly protein TadB